MKTTVEIADPLFRQVKTLAGRDGLTFRDLVEEGLRAVVQARSRSSAKPFRLRDAGFRGRGLQPGLDWDRIAALAYEDEGARFRR